MALSWSAKAPGDTYRYTWVPALLEGDSLASYTVEVDGAVIEAQEQDGDEVVLFVSGGTSGAAATFTFTGESADGESLTETIYLPIRTGNTNTAQDVCAFALRKVFGNGEDPPADAAEDALERLNDMLAAWTRQGADVGAAAPLELTSELLLADAFLSAIKNNLILHLADNYGLEVPAIVAMNARTGLQTIKAANLSADREGGDYY